jgi:nitrogen fixation protein NifB
VNGDMSQEIPMTAEPIRSATAPPQAPVITRRIPPASQGHPCFDASSRARTARVHLPVAPRCNIRCGYCDRRSDCVAESRPGVSSTVLTPPEAADYLAKVVTAVPALTVVGIAGPGDPFANAEQTLETLRLCRDRHPELTLCLATNGLALPEHLDEIAELGVSHVTITMNTVDPEVGARLYRWVRDGRKVYRGEAGARLLMERQLTAVAGLKARGVIVKINTILVPGVTLDGVADVARTVAGLGADTMNCIPLYPVEGTPLAVHGPPDDAQIARARIQAGAHLAQMVHCTRCRADAVGLLGENHTAESLGLLDAVRRERAANRPYLAATSMEGLLVNLHLGAADRVHVIERTPSGVRTVAVRALPAPGGGARRWRALAEVLSDCRALLASQVGEMPRAVLERAGIEVHETEGLLAEAADAVFTGRAPVRRLPVRGCSAGEGDDLCSGGGTGCG